MEGLRYLAVEIEQRRHLLHEFIKDAGFIRNMVTGAAKNPETYGYIKNGEIEFSPYRKDLYVDPANPAKYFGIAPVFPDLTFEQLIPYLRDFYDDKKGSILTMPVTPFASPPADCEARFELIYVLGGGGYGAYLRATLDSKTPKRRFSIMVRHNFLPENYRESIGYKSWKKIRRKVSDICRESLISADFIEIDEDTKPSDIWGQLLAHALSQGYFNDRDILPGTSVYKQIARVFHLQYPDLVSDLITHFLLKRCLYPYTPKSSGAYIGITRAGYFKKTKQERTDGESMGLDGFHTVYLFTYPPGSVPRVSARTGIPKSTIYRLIQSGNIEAQPNNKGCLQVTQDGISEVNRLSIERKRRRDIYLLAELRGKNREATKKWLQRHRQMPDDKLREQLVHWLGIQP